MPTIGTYTGKHVDPLNLDPDLVCIEDIAHALSNKCRYTGHCTKFYSVAQHSVLVARHCSHPHKYAALMHDATEAYLPDVAKPIKHLIQGFKSIEANVAYAIAQALCVPHPLPNAVHISDMTLLKSEYAQLMTQSLNDPEYDKYRPINYSINVWHPQMAEEMFLAAYEGLKP